MYCLSGHAWWFWAIFHAGKDIENRAWDRAPTWRGRFLLHASKTRARHEYEDCAMAMWEADLISGLEVLNRRLPIPVAPPAAARNKPALPAMDALPLGHLIGHVALTGTRRNQPDDPNPWSMDGQLGLLLADPIAFEPVPMLGALGFFDVPETEQEAESLLRRSMDLEQAKSRCSASRVLRERGFFTSLPGQPDLFVAR